ncbi:uncharacterized protein LOC100703668 isoform X3 [Oreochromis niloticus]|uniref:uncharacterized protein LOC100703668 isoform X3 n=1 Tax=Oreochromis niloticus TaxID=8128 RepID=UPI000673F93A|nr:uncharacterized protein LOC100703668 isoform X3 [Oreochromis niloticus]
MNWNNACLQIAASCDTKSTCFLTDPLQIKSESTGIDKHSLFFSVVKNMSDTRDYQRLLDQEEVEQVSWETFHVWLTGRTNEAHYPIIEMLKRIGQTQVNSPEECDYLLVFCPIVSRVGTDIEEALNNLPCSKPVILVVMHHTFNPHSVVSESKRQVNNPNVHLTVDCLFYEDKLLNCKLNDNIEKTLLKLFKLSVYQMILWCKYDSLDVMLRHFFKLMKTFWFKFHQPYNVISVDILNSFLLNNSIFLYCLFDLRLFLLVSRVNKIASSVVMSIRNKTMYKHG